MEHSAITAKASQDSITSDSNGLSVSPSSNITDELKTASQCALSPQEEDSPHGDTGKTISPTRAAPTTNGTLHTQSHHVIQLSSIEHCMPRAYIRVCLAYSLPADVHLNAVVNNLNKFARRVVNSKPYLSGYVVPTADTTRRSHVAEIHFTEHDYSNYPHIQVRHLTSEEVPFTYKELNEQCLPPSVIRPELISALPEGTDDERAPVFRMQANIVKGGLIVSVYLHHCISDGQGLGFLISGKVLSDDLKFNRHLETQGFNTPGFNNRLAAWCGHHNSIRTALSWSDGNQISNRQIKHKLMSEEKKTEKSGSPPGRGCILAFSKSKLETMKTLLQEEVPKSFITSHDALLALLWQHMTIARKHSISDSIQTSKLFIPVNIRTKIPNLPHAKSYFGAAVDFACAELLITHLSEYNSESLGKLAKTAVAIRQAIEKVDEVYVRQLIALANIKDPNIDVRDVMASNMNRASGADMYITSWEKLELYDATFDMGLGKPDWVRKPWSKDPGSCVVLPRDDRKSYVEVLVQMTEDDMLRLLRDTVFMSYVIRTVDGPPEVG